MSNQSENNDEENCTIDDYNLNSDTETEKNSEVNELQILYNAAMILREKVQEIPKLNLPWPPLASDLTMDNVQKVVHVNFIICWLGLADSLQSQL